MAPFARKIHKMGGRFYINPDGLEWKRAKWAKPIQAYLKYSEKIMTRHADLVISDNPGIESYIKEAILGLRRPTLPMERTYLRPA